MLATYEDGPDELQGSQSKRDAPTDSELAEAVAEAEAALRQGVDPSDIAAEDRAADVDAGDFAVDVEAVEAGGASDDVDTSGEGCALEGGGVPEHLDYRVWNVAYADGTSVRFDSVLGEALIDQQDAARANGADDGAVCDMGASLPEQLGPLRSRHFDSSMAITWSVESLEKRFPRPRGSS